MKRKLIAVLPVLCTMGAFLLYSQEISFTVLESIRLCGTAIIPALFPMFVVAKLLCSQLSGFSLPKFFQRAWSKLFGLSGESAYAFLFGILGGYPLGISVICHSFQKKQLSRRDAEHAMALCNNSGPGFFAAAVGAKVLGNVQAGLILYGIHIFSAILTGILYAKKTDAPFTFQNKRPIQSKGSLVKAIQESCTSLLNISALVIFFHVLVRLVDCMGIFDLLYFIPGQIPVEDLKALLHGSLELTGGIIALNGSENAFVLSAFLMGWGGLCVHSQAKLLWQEADLHPKGYYFHKMSQAFISVILAWSFTRNLIPYSALSLLFLSILVRFFRNRTGKKVEYAV